MSTGAGMVESQTRNTTLPASPSIHRRTGSSRWCAQVVSSALVSSSVTMRAAVSVSSPPTRHSRKTARTWARALAGAVSSAPNSRCVRSGHRSGRWMSRAAEPRRMFAGVSCCACAARRVRRSATRATSRAASWSWAAAPATPSALVVMRPANTRVSRTGSVRDGGACAHGVCETRRPVQAGRAGVTLSVSAPSRKEARCRDSTSR